MATLPTAFRLGVRAGPVLEQGQSRLGLRDVGGRRGEASSLKVSTGSSSEFRQNVLVGS